MLLFQLLIIGFLCYELIQVLLGLERHKYINGSYDHSIQHFAYLLTYLTGFILITLGGELMNSGFFFIGVGTLFLLYHISMERLGLL